MGTNISLGSELYEKDRQKHKRKDSFCGMEAFL
jgi:hypothetical protein